MFARIIRRLAIRSLAAPMLLVIGAIAMAAEGTESPPRPGLAPGNYSFTVKFGGANRSYLVHVPPQAAAGAPLPVVLNFHGAGSNGAQQEKYSRMDEASDRDGFIAAYPNGSSGIGNHLTWNAGFCCGYAMTHQVDDVGFTLELLNDLAPRIPIKRRRVYATGLSNGAMMCYRLATQASSHIAAIAPVAGTMVTRTFMPVHPMPIMHFHSVDDPYVRYEGGGVRSYGFFVAARAGRASKRYSRNGWGLMVVRSRRR